jgi:hypothetical protein
MSKILIIEIHIVQDKLIKYMIIELFYEKII